MILELNTKDGIDIWKAIPFCLIWRIWREKKRGIFEGWEILVGGLKNVFLRTLHMWTKAMNPSSPLNL